MKGADRAEVVRGAFAAADRHDRARLFDLLCPDVEWHLLGLVAGHPSLQHGREEIWRQSEMLHSRYDDMRVEVEEVEEVGSQVVARLHARGRGRDGQEDLDVEFTGVFRVQDGRISRAANYEDHDEALTHAELAR